MKYPGYLDNPLIGEWIKCIIKYVISHITNDDDHLLLILIDADPSDQVGLPTNYPPFNVAVHKLCGPLVSPQVSNQSYHLDII